jgi:hypothetical protein
MSERTRQNERASSSEKKGDGRNMEGEQQRK